MPKRNRAKKTNTPVTRKPKTTFRFLRGEKRKVKVFKDSRGNEKIRILDRRKS